ncbi:unnamed protein product (macronuclear) [Paramecium tetraurelia]|uniref:Ion transport domain-containing protein n=1 Tax=Paramecium tetraurelia TaxID=5888 RepID=A0DWV8_PARTE|nr:uncharacterized protein GSPATT00021168001 [Paramecium tetraurelia]CAK87525.1 unnamed protein product [Paramecium tetraurelia]|eukprot:XP_001454922.1 hypothetical protein (macronuclear) [Paramecium tetraurelia strain d4-2]
MNQHQEDAEIFDIPTSKRNSELNGRALSSTVFAIIYNFCWGLLFFLFRHYNDQSCDSINAWSLYAEIFLFLMAGYKLQELYFLQRIIELPIQHKTNGVWKDKLFDAVDYVELFFNILILIGLTYAYLQHEECTHLRMFILSYLVVTYFIILVWILTMIYLICNRDEQSRSS